jgi:hypothetical protein
MKESILKDLIENCLGFRGNQYTEEKYRLSYDIRQAGGVKMLAEIADEIAVEGGARS